MVHGLSVKVVFLCLFSKCSLRNASPCAETKGHAFAYHNLFVYHDCQTEDIYSVSWHTLFSFDKKKKNTANVKIVLKFF